MIPDVVLDAGESGCGELVMLVFQTMKTLAAGQVLEVHAYDSAAYVDLAAWCRMTGNPLVEHDLSANPQRFFIQKKTLRTYAVEGVLPQLDCGAGSPTAAQLRNS